MGFEMNFYENPNSICKDVLSLKTSYSDQFTYWI